MTFSRTLVVDNTTDVITNIWAMDPDCGYPCPDDSYFVGYDGPSGVGWKWDRKNNRAISPPPPAPTKKQYQDAIQAVMDTLSQAWGYDDARSAVSYVGDPNTRFNLEGVSIRDWRSAVWVTAEQILATADPENPPTVDEVIAQLPAAPERPVVPVA